MQGCGGITTGDEGRRGCRVGPSRMVAGLRRVLDEHRTALVVDGLVLDGLCACGLGVSRGRGLLHAAHATKPVRSVALAFRLVGV